MPSTTFYNKQTTATADEMFQVEDDPKLVLSSVNIYCYTNDAYLGNRGLQQGVIRANAVVWFDKPVKICDIWFKNFTAGSNATIVIQGTIEQDGT